MSNIVKRATTVLVSLAMSAGLCFGLAACSGGQSEEEQIRASLDEALSALKNPTAESLEKVLGDNVSSLDQVKQYGIDPIEMLQHFFGKFDYSIGDIKVNGDTADAKVTMENVDIQSVINETTANMQNDPEFVKAATEAYTSGDQTTLYKLIFDKMFAAIDASDKTVSNTVDFKLVKKDGKWDIDESSANDLISSLYGGLDMSAL